MIDAATPGPMPAERYRRSDFAHSPMLVFYEVTQACDLACSHCRACAQLRPNPHELNSDESRLLIDQLAGFPKPPMLILTGGDPLKRRDIFSLVEYARQRGLDVSITPAGTPLATTAALARLRDAGISRLAVSLDGADAPTHDGLRGVAGSYQRTREILDDARRLGIATQVNTVVTRLNHQQIDTMADLLADSGIVLWSVFFLVPVGRAAANIRLDAEQCEQVFARLWRQSQRQPYGIKTTEAPHYRRFVLQQQQQQRQTGAAAVLARQMPGALNDGRGVMFVGHTGLIYPSGFLPILCGLFPLDHLVRVYQSSPIFLGLREADRLEGKCGHCEFRHLCGGSRARSYALTGNLFAEEPDCVYQPTACGAGV